eukprot:896868-Prymnesium_polylepis.2
MQKNRVGAHNAACRVAQNELTSLESLDASENLCAREASKRRRPRYLVERGERVHVAGLRAANAEAAATVLERHLALPVQGGQMALVIRRAVVACDSLHPATFCNETCECADRWVSNEKVVWRSNAEHLLDRCEKRRRLDRDESVHEDRKIEIDVIPAERAQQAYLRATLGVLDCGVDRHVEPRFRFVGGAGQFRTDGVSGKTGVRVASIHMSG